MPDAATTDPTADLPATVRAAARGELPPWAEASPRRREHIARVAALLDQWADAAELDPRERDRWVAAGWLHDALRDADPERLRAAVPERFRVLPGPVLHGPAAAERLAGEADAEIRDAIRYHTLGHPGFGPLGKALYLADFLEPGRDFEPEWRASLAARMPAEMDEVLIEVLRSRIRHLIDRRKPVSPETAAFWSALVGVGG
ncbi:MAG TPA: HD domain-containing protein [Longimicrobiaceae bacterium]|nr:HD domain-containing protein [Longimicrobiaceae bacterium]